MVPNGNVRWYFNDKRGIVWFAVPENRVPTVGVASIHVPTVGVASIHCTESLRKDGLVD
jgi:hypothetical protein